MMAEVWALNSRRFCLPFDEMLTRNDGGIMDFEFTEICLRFDKIFARNDGGVLGLEFKDVWASKC